MFMKKKRYRLKFVILKLAIKVDSVRLAVQCRMSLELLMKNKDKAEFPFVIFGVHVNEATGSFFYYFQIQLLCLFV